MNPRTTGLLLLVAIALGAFVWFYEIQGEAERERAAQREKELFPALEAGDIDAIELTTRDGAEARLERSEGGFRLVAPLAFPADTFAADGIASNLAGLTQEAAIEDPQPLAEYGLAEDARVVRFTAGDESHVLRLGDDTPVGANTYATLEGEGEVVTVPRFAARSFDKSLAELRERRIAEFDPASIDRVALSWPDERVVLERAGATPEPGEAGAAEGGEAAEPAAGADADAAEAQDTGVWRMVEPVAARADDETVDRLLSNLSFLRAEGFVDDPPPPSRAGLAPPSFSATLTGPPPAEGAEAPRVHVEFGGPHEGDQRLVRAGQPSLYTIPDERFRELPRKVATYRDRRLARFAVDEAEQLDLFFQPSSGDPVAVKAVREDGSWSSSPEAMAPGRLDALVAALSDLEASEVVADDPDAAQLEALGLSPPRVILTVFGRADESEPAAGEPALPRLAEIQIGRVEGSEWIVARKPESDVVYGLPYEMAETLPVSLEALRNRFTVPAAPEADPAAGEPEFLSPRQESP